MASATLSSQKPPLNLTTENTQTGRGLLTNQVQWVLALAGW